MYRSRKVVDVAETISRRAQIKQAYLWRVFVDRKRLSRRIRAAPATGRDQSRSKQRAERHNFSVTNQIHSKTSSKVQGEIVRDAQHPHMVSKNLRALRGSQSQIR